MAQYVIPFNSCELAHAEYGCSQDIVKRIPCMLMCIGRDTIDEDDKLDELS